MSIDPHQRSVWHGCGLAAVRRAGLAHRHALVERPDHLALPALAEEGTRVEFAYIDGMHTFDHVLLDFWYLDHMLSPCGVVAFNDCGRRAVHKVIRFILSHRQYSELDVGLGQAYRDRTLLRRIVRRVRRIPSADFFRNANDRYFEKQADCQPKWDFFADF